MNRRSATAARVFGLVLFIAIAAWDIDAMRPHIAAHSWTTLAFVSLFLAAHLSDYFTVGRLVNRLDPLTFTNAEETADAVEYDTMRPSLVPRQPAALYVFPSLTATDAVASDAPWPIVPQAHHHAAGVAPPGDPLEIAILRKPPGRIGAHGSSPGMQESA
jgi:hypothetical protein